MMIHKVFDSLRLYIIKEGTKTLILSILKVMPDIESLIRNKMTDKAMALLDNLSGMLRASF